MHDRGAGPRAATHQDRRGDRLLGDRRVVAQRGDDAEAVLEVAHHHLASAPSTDEVEVGLLLERGDGDVEGFRVRVVTEVAGSRAERRFLQELGGVERARGEVVDRPALAGQRVRDPRGARSGIPRHG